MKDSGTQAVLLQGHVENGLYVLQTDAEPTPPQSSISPQAYVGLRTTAQLWHSMLGHPCPCTTSLILRQYSLPLSTSTSLQHCFAYTLAKAHALPHPSSPSRSSYPFQLLFFDVWGVLRLPCPQKDLVIFSLL